MSDIAGEDPPVAALSAARSVAGERWPGEEARAFAVSAARAYLTFSPRHPGYQARALRGFMSAELGEEALVRLPRRGPDQTVEGATVARVRRVSDSEALITVACTVLARTVSTRYLTVPVARDARGGLAVVDLPFFSPPPPAAAERTAAAAGTVGVQGDDAAAIEALVRRFLGLYLAGQPVEQLSYFLAPGAGVRALGQGLQLRGVDEVSQLGEGVGRRRVVLVSVQVRDPETRAVYAQRVRVELVRRDRWYVQAIQGATESPMEGSRR